jgi:cytochrome b subunit of formate dehydrogenase
MTAEEIIVIIAGIQMIIGTFFLNTTGLFYTTMYKILPFFLGLGCLWSVRHLYL